MSVEATVSAIMAALSGARVCLSDEKAAQVDISQAFTAAGVEHKREARLAPGDVVDFQCAEGVVVEVKMHRACAPQIFKQLARYARHDVVSAVVLVTNRAMGLPGAIEGKPAFYVSLGRAWL